MPKHHSFLGGDVPATGTKRQRSVTSAARCPAGSRRGRRVGPRSGGGANTRARPRGDDVTAPSRTRARTHAHCAQHESRGSDQVTPRWCHLPPPLPASSPFKLMGGRCWCCCRRRRKEGVCAGPACRGLGGSSWPEEEAEPRGCGPARLVPAELGSRPSSPLVAAPLVSRPSDLDSLGFTWGT